MLIALTFAHHIAADRPHLTSSRLASSDFSYPQAWHVAGASVLFSHIGGISVGQVQAGPRIALRNHDNQAKKLTLTQTDTNTHRWEGDDGSGN